MSNQFLPMPSIRNNYNPFHNHHLKYELSMHGKSFIAGWANVEIISSLAEPTWKSFHRWLSKRGNHFIAGWANVEIISSLAEPTWKQTIRIWQPWFGCKSGKKLLIPPLPCDLKGPKREIFVAGIFAQIRPIWLGYLVTRHKNTLGPL